MTDTRRWYTEPETFIAVAALIVSISAVTVGLYEASLQRHHDRAEVWPRVELSTFTTPTGASLSLENTGIGPAIIKSLTVSVDGKPQKNWSGVLQALLGTAPQAFNTTTVVEHGIRAGDRATMVGLRREDMPQNFWQQIGRVAVTVCYASVFDEHWMLIDEHLGGRTVWKPVDDCPAPLPETDF